MLLNAIKLTKHLLARGKSSNGGWSKEQLECLGVPWPLTIDWQDKIIGKKFAGADIERFLLLKDKHLPVSQRKSRRKKKRFRYAARTAPVNEKVDRSPVTPELLKDCPFDVSREQTKLALLQMQELEEMDRSFDLDVSGFDHAISK